MMRWDSLELACWYVGGPFGHARYVFSSFVAIFERDWAMVSIKSQQSMLVLVLRSNSALGGD